MKKWIAAIVSVCVLWGSVAAPVGTEAWGAPADVVTEQTSETSSEEYQGKPTGLLQTEQIEIPLEQIPEDAFFHEEESGTVGMKSAVYTTEWDKYTSYFYYNQMNAEERAFYDSLDEMCRGYLMSKMNMEEYRIEGSLYAGTELVPAGSLSSQQTKEIAWLFRYSHPQYYFLNNQTFFTTLDSGEMVLGFGCYSAFADGYARNTATENVKKQAEVLAAKAEQGTTDLEKVKLAHDAINEKVSYHHDAFEEKVSEDESYTQSVYSVLCTDMTVCAGYTMTFEMICNSMDLDVFVANSEVHAWNKVRLGGSWYVVDLTWDDVEDPEIVNTYDFFLKSETYVDEHDQDYAHQEEEYIEKYQPTCTRNAESTEDGSFSLPESDGITKIPVISYTEEDHCVTISCDTENADIFYTLDDTAPSVAYSKAYLYDGMPIELEGEESVSAIAVSDNRVDSLTAYYPSKNLPVIRTFVFDGNGAISGSMESIERDMNANDISGKRLPKNTYEYPGHEFVGWNTHPYGVGYVYSDEEKLENILVGADKIIKLYAQWAVIDYEISYVLNGGDNSSRNPAYYTVYDEIVFSRPTREGYEFEGWYSDSGFKNRVIWIEEGSTGDLVLYAKWRKLPSTITYYLNGGKNASDNPLSYTGDEAILLKNPTRTGYSFEGWYPDSGLRNRVTSIAKGTTGDLTLYAQWIPNTYQIRFNGNKNTGGKMSSLQFCIYGKDYKLTANSFKRKGYMFAGWNTRADGKGKSYANKAAIRNLTAKDGATITLYAQWKKTKYKITYQLKGGKNSKKNPTSYYYTSKTITLKNPTRKGYVFKGWYADKKYKKKVTSIKKGGTGNIVLYAKWKKK